MRDDSIVEELMKEKEGEHIQFKRQKIILTLAMRLNAVVHWRMMAGVN